MVLRIHVCPLGSQFSRYGTFERIEMIRGSRAGTYNFNTRDGVLTHRTVVPHLGLISILYAPPSTIL